MIYHIIIDLLCWIQRSKADVLGVVFPETAQQSENSISLDPAKDA
jgi:hypothetical protein